VRNLISKEKQEEIEKTLASFIHDFNNLDMEKLGTYFSDDATTFPRVIMSSKSSRDITLSDLWRILPVNLKLKYPDLPI